MGRLSTSQAARRAEALLREWLGDDARFERRPARAGDDGADLVVRAGRATLVIEIKATSDSSSIAPAIEQARHVARRFGKGSVPTVVVPFMGESGRRFCDQSGVSWFDLSGNARIVAPGLRIHVEGRPNGFKRPGRPSTVFAPRSSRIVRQLLMEVDRSYHQRELSQITGLNEGFTSRVVRKLETDGMIVRDKSGAVRAREPGLLLDAWREAYDFGKHHVIRGHFATRSAEEGQKRLIDVLKQGRLRCAATGLGAAWLLTKFAGFRLVTVYANEEPDSSLLEAAGFRAEERGSNTWLVVPNDDGVFAGAAEQNGIPCVHPVQVYLDLKALPERAAEASTELRKQFLSWSR